MSTRRQVNSVLRLGRDDVGRLVDGGRHGAQRLVVDASAGRRTRTSIRRSTRRCVLSDAIPGIKKAGLSFLKLRGSYAQGRRRRAALPARDDLHGQLEQVQRPAAVLAVEHHLEPGAQAGDHDVVGRRCRSRLGSTAASRSTRATTASRRATRSSTSRSRRRRASPEGDQRRPRRQQGLSKRCSPSFRSARRTASSGPRRSTTRTTRARSSRSRPGIKTIMLGSTWNTNVEAREGQPYGAIFGYAFLRDSATGQLITSGGLTQAWPAEGAGQLPAEVGRQLQQHVHVQELLAQRALRRTSRRPVLQRLELVGRLRRRHQGQLDGPRSGLEQPGRRRQGPRRGELRRRRPYCRDGM